MFVDAVMTNFITVRDKSKISLLKQPLCLWRTLLYPTKRSTAEGSVSEPFLCRYQGISRLAAGAATFQHLCARWASASANFCSSSPPPEWHRADQREQLVAGVLQLGAVGDVAVKGRAR